MLFALLGRYDPTHMTGNFRRERTVMGDPPPGVEVLARYARVGGRGGFVHIVKTESAEQLGALMLEFVDHVEFEVIPLVELTGSRGSELVARYFEEDVPMHGPM